MGSKLRFETDPHNRLLVRSSSLRVPQYRRTLEGTFKAGKGNVLVYQLRKSSGSDVPQQIKFTGNWTFEKGETLVFTLDKWSNRGHTGKLYIGAKAIDARSDELVFEVNTKNTDNSERFYLLRLTGIWQADMRNRLNFVVEKERGDCDRLTFEGSWSINEKNQLAYVLASRRLKRKKDRTRALVFKGEWEMADRHTLSYVLSRELGSRFDFQVGLRRAGEGFVRYEMFIGAHPAGKSITLKGNWNLDARKGIIFEMKKEGERVSRLTFGGKCRLARGKVIEAHLLDAAGKDTGVSLKLSRALAKGAGEGFLEVLASGRECVLSAGYGLLW